MDWAKKNGLKYKLESFPEILSACWASANSATNIRNGFKTTGLWPLNSNWISENKKK